MSTEFSPLPNGFSRDAKLDRTTAEVKTKDQEEKEAVIDAGLRSLDHCMVLYENGKME